MRGSWRRASRCRDDPRRAMRRPPDLLPLDDAAWAVVPDDRVRHVLLVGPGQRLPAERARRCCPTWSCTASRRRSGRPARAQGRASTWSCSTGSCPTRCPDTPILAFAPPRAQRPGRRWAATIAAPGVGDASRRRAAAARRGPEPLPCRARPADGQRPTGRGSWCRVRRTRRSSTAACGTASRRPCSRSASRRATCRSRSRGPSCWPTSHGRAAGHRRRGARPVAPATPARAGAAPGRRGVRVTLPDGSVREVAPGAPGLERAFVRRQLGSIAVERGSWTRWQGSPGSTGRAATPSWPWCAAGPGRTADLVRGGPVLEPGESSIAPGDGSALAALGGAAGTSASAGHGA